jgi:iron(III) transport system substrate-binding protein
VHRHRLIVLGCLVALLVVFIAPVAAQTPVVNVYSARHYGAMEDAFAAFTEATGIQVRLSQGSAQSILERLRAEGSQTPADVFFTIDAGGLDLAAEEGLLQPIDSQLLRDLVPEDLRDPEDRWFAVSQRFRTIMVNPAVVEEGTVTSYADLADPQWAGRLCLRPASHIYTVSLVGALIAELGEAEVETIVAGWVANEPQYIDSDTRILETIEAGGCDIAITNHYYLARKLNENPEFPVSLVWANQGDDQAGVFRNISGVGMTAAALNQANAVTLIEWMVREGQAADASGIPGGNYEYPVNLTADLHPIIAEFGEFKIDPLPLTEYGNGQEAAIALLERVGYGF